MKAKDIMTSPVVSVGPDATVREVAALMLDMRISAVPVLEAGRLAGIVSEADLLHRHELGTEASGRPWWVRLLSADASLEEYVKSHARRAGDVMTRKVVSVADDAPLAAVVSLLERHGVKRLPVLRGERLVGIVSRSDLVRALARRSGPAKRASREDEAIRRDVLAELKRHPWWRRVASNVVVSGGFVHFWGTIEMQAERDAARVAAENVPGVRGVEDHRLRVYDLPSMV
ncbi:MAG: CBS domain-containing protein [Betaproteobacteria bacterium]